MQRTPRPARTALAVASVVVLTLSACGGDDDDPAADAPAEEPATTEPADEPPAEEPAAEVPMAPSSLTLSDQSGDGASVTVDGVELPADGFVAVHGDGGGSPGPVIGVSDLLPEGASSDVTITLDEPLTASGTVFPMVHIDTNANGVYEFGSVEGVDGPGTTADGSVAVGPVEITVGDGGDAGDAGGAFDYGDLDDGGAGDDGGDGDAADGEHVITIAGFAFSGVAEVPVGTTVTVTNEDGTPHTWTSVDDTFDSGAIGAGESFEFTFTEPGTYSYFCAIHPSMSGEIVVTG